MYIFTNGTLVLDEQHIIFEFIKKLQGLMICMVFGESMHVCIVVKFVLNNIITLFILFKGLFHWEVPGLASHTHTPIHLSFRSENDAHVQLIHHQGWNPSCSLQKKSWTLDPDWQDLGRSTKLSFFIMSKFWQNCASVGQVSDLILKTAAGWPAD